MHPRAIRRLVLASDLIWICLSAIITYFLRTGISLTWENLHIAFYGSLFLMTASSIAWVFVFYRLKLDGFYGGYEFAAVVSQLFSGLLALIVLVASAAYLAKDSISRLLMFYFVSLFFLGALAGRMFLRVLANQLSGKGKRRRVLILGNGKVAQEIVQRIKRHPEMRWEIVGFLFPSREDFGEPFVTASQSAQLNSVQIESLLQQEQVEEVVLASPGLERTEILNVIANCRYRGIQFSIVPHLYELYVTRPALMDLDGLPLLTLAEHGPTLFQGFVKRSSDIVLSLIALALALPVLVISAILLWQQKNKVFVAEKRCGRNGRVFQMYRFNIDRANAGGSAVERLLQKSSITELPQLINVLKGEMSLVGPRPEPEEKVQRYSDWQSQRLVLKPGMTGLAQVHGLREENSSEDKAYYDLRYMQNWSLLADASLILQTVWTITSRFVSTRTPELDQFALLKPPSQSPAELAHADRP